EAVWDAINAPKDGDIVQLPEGTAVWKNVEGKPFRITGITFDGTGLPTAGTWAGEIVISGNCKNFRVDHCKFLNMDRMMTINESKGSVVKGVRPIIVTVEPLRDF